MNERIRTTLLVIQHKSKVLGNISFNFYLGKYQ